MRVPHDWQRDHYAGCCPFHDDCLEGLASGRAMEVRWGQSSEKLPCDHPGWELEAGYLASAVMNLIYVMSRQRIIIGGGEEEGCIQLTGGRSGFGDLPSAVFSIDRWR